MLGFYILRLWLSCFGGIHPDEAYYWAWSKSLSLGYYDHPPLIAWIIALSRSFVETLIPGILWKNSPLFYQQLGLRWLPYFISCFVLPLVLGRIVEVSQRKPLGVFQMILIMTSPLMFWGPQVITPDTPFFLMWSVVLLLCLKIYRGRPANAVMGDSTPFQKTRAIRLGLALAACAYSKYTAVIAVPLILISGVGFWNSLVAGTIALLAISPYLAWNLGAGFEKGAGIFFQLDHGFSTAGLSQINYARAGDLLVSQVFFWTPFVFFGILVIPLLRFRTFFKVQKKSPLIGTLALWAWLPLLFFCITALTKKAEANWPLVGALAALALFASQTRRSATWDFLQLSAHIGSIVLAFLFLFQNKSMAEFFQTRWPRLAVMLDHPSRIYEFQDWDKFYKLVSESTLNPAFPIEVQSYQLMSQLMFHDVLAEPGQELSHRLRIWYEGSKVSDFHLRPERVLPQPQGPRWLLAGSQSPGEALDPTCRLYQTLFKNPFEGKTYGLFRCGF